MGVITMTVRKCQIPKSLFLLMAAALCLGAGGCKKSSDTKSVVDNAAPGVAVKPPADKPMPTGLPVVDEPSDPVTPQSSDDKLAQHFRITIDELKQIRDTHATFPVLELPAWAAEAKQDKGLPKKNAAIAMPPFRVITAQELSNVETVKWADILNSVKEVSQRAFALKIPVFTKPIVFLDLVPDAPEGRASAFIGLPVPDSVKIPKGLQTRVMNQGKALFLGYKDIDSLGISSDAKELMNKLSPQLAVEGKCEASLMVMIEDWPTGNPGQREGASPATGMAKPTDAMNRVLLICR